MFNKRIITALSLNNSNAELLKNLDEKVKKYTQQITRSKLNEARKLLRIELNDNEANLTDEQIADIKHNAISEKELNDKRIEFLRSLTEEKNNYLSIRKDLHHLNDLWFDSVEVEKTGLMRYEKLLSYEDLVLHSVNLTYKFREIIKDINQQIEGKLKANYDVINEQINSRGNALDLENKVLDLLSKMREMYSITFEMDDFEIIDRYDFNSNIDYANELSKILSYFTLSGSHRLIDILNSDNITMKMSKEFKGIKSLLSSGQVTEKTLAKFFSDTMISNNKVLTYENMFTTETSFDTVYKTRTMGELLFEITNENLRYENKDSRQQLYMIYDINRPSKDDYYLWNGMQVFDLDLKSWISEYGGNIDLLKTQLYNELKKFHWFAWICFSSRRNGLHIYTKVTPPHHVYTNPTENNYISEYYHQVNYLTKQSVIYDIINKISATTDNKFPIEEDLVSNKYLDNSVARITSGIRLAYDENPYINNDFIDISLCWGLGQTYSGFENVDKINNILLRETKLKKKINDELAIEDINQYRVAPEIDISKYVTLGLDIENINQLPRNNINYVTRYNVCNTLASIFGKEGIEIAHNVLDSRGCNNVGEINSFYSCAMSNGKQPTKLGLEILKKIGIIKNVDDELIEMVDEGFRGELAQEIIDATKNEKDEISFNLSSTQYLGDIKEEIESVIVNDKINIILSPAGSGKCLGFDTGVLMFDGSVKKVQDIKVGDKLMGIDSKPRNVLSTTKGREEMFRITPIKGESWTCNRSHILSLIDTNKYGFDDIYNKELVINPSVISDENIDWIIENHNNKSKDLKLFKTALETVNDYVTGLPLSIEDRKLFIQNSIDEYGVCRYEEFYNLVIFYARSVGYTTKIKDGYLYVNVSETTDENFESNMVQNFTYESIGEGDYYGFQIDGDNRFMLEDFTVTHNTELIKQLAREGKKIFLVLPYVSIIKNKIIKDDEINEMFDNYYSSRSLDDMEYGRNVVTTFDKFSRVKYEKIARMFDYIFIDESHLIFTSSYRINATANMMKRLKELYYISSNDKLSAKVAIFTGTETGELHFFQKISNITRISKPSHTKKMDFLICGNTLDAITKMSKKVSEYLNDGYRILIPTNKGEIYTEKLIGMVEHLMKREVKYGYYKRSNDEQEICRLINNHDSIGDFEIVFCTNYLSVGVDIKDQYKFASMYLGSFAGYEIEQFNARIRRTGIDSFYCVVTENANGEIRNDLLEEPDLVLHLTDSDKLHFLDDKSISDSKVEFMAKFDPILHKITTAGFSLYQGKIQFNLDEYELVTFEEKYNSCMEHPVKVARELSKYGYQVSVSTNYEGFDKSEQEILKQLGNESAHNEKVRKHSLMIGTYVDLISKNKFVSDFGLEFNNVIEYIQKSLEQVIEVRDLTNDDGTPCFVNVIFDVMAQPIEILVRSKEALDKIIRQARFLSERYSETKSIEYLYNYVDENGIIKMKNFQRSINLNRLIEKSDSNELSDALRNTIEDMYQFVDRFETRASYRISNESYNSVIDNFTYNYIDMIGVKINTEYGFEKIRESIVEMLSDIATKQHSRQGMRFTYNKIPEQNNTNVLNRRSIDSIVLNMFSVMDSIKTNSSREKHIIELQKQEF